MRTAGGLRGSLGALLFVAGIVLFAYSLFGFQAYAGTDVSLPAGSWNAGFRYEAHARLELAAGAGLAAAGALLLRRW